MNWNLASEILQCLSLVLLSVSVSGLRHRLQRLEKRELNVDLEVGVHWVSPEEALDIERARERERLLGGRKHDA